VRPVAFPFKDHAALIFFDSFLVSRQKRNWGTGAKPLRSFGSFFKDKMNCRPASGQKNELTANRSRTCFRGTLGQAKFRHSFSKTLCKTSTSSAVTKNKKDVKQGSYLI